MFSYLSKNVNQQYNPFRFACLLHFYDNVFSYAAEGSTGDSFAWNSGGSDKQL
jgi:hypothetical protein